MTLLLLLVFVVGYAAIAFEHAIGVNKAGSALITGGACWTILALGGAGGGHLDAALGHQLGDIAGIVFFLLGAMTIVELIAAHGGFELITERITERRHGALLWIIALLTFFLSAVLDNLTTTIVMVTLLRKLTTEEKDRVYFASVVVIAANAGGAWSPIGDVTTTMLWIGGQISAGAIVLSTFLPSLVAMALPIGLLSLKLKGRLPEAMHEEAGGEATTAPPQDRRFMLLTGIAVLLFVPVFKTITHLPPYMGMLIGLGIMWVITAVRHKDKNASERRTLSITSALQRADAPSILFFVGILLSVAALQHAGLLDQLALWMTRTLEWPPLIVALFGLLSAIIDNVPLVAGVQGMFSLEQYPMDNAFWQFLAYCAGTGGSALIIGSAAGVAAMGIGSITFFWYLKRITGYALLGYVAGALAFLLQQALL